MVAGNFNDGKLNDLDIKIGRNSSPAPIHCPSLIRILTALGRKNGFDRGRYPIGFHYH